MATHIREMKSSTTYRAADENEAEIQSVHFEKLSKREQKILLHVKARFRPFLANAEAFRLGATCRTNSLPPSQPPPPPPFPSSLPSYSPHNYVAVTREHLVGHHPHFTIHTPPIPHHPHTIRTIPNASKTSLYDRKNTGPRRPHKQNTLFHP